MIFNDYENDEEDYNSEYDEDFDFVDELIPEIDYDNRKDNDKSNYSKSDHDSTYQSNNNNNNNFTPENGSNKNSKSVLNDNFDSILNDSSDSISKDNSNSFNKTPKVSEDYFVKKPVDVRIIVEGHQNSEFLSKVVRSIDFWDDFPIIVSSIVTTNNVEIAKNAVVGSDIILIATTPDEEGKKLFSTFYKVLKNDFNYVELLKFPKFRSAGVPDLKKMENEIKNSVIQAGLSSIFDVVNINQVKSDLKNLKQNYNNSIDSNEKISLENETLINEAHHLREENKELSEEIKRLRSQIDNVKLEFSDFKSRFSNIHSRNLLEIFSISTIWNEIFNENLNEENIDKIVIATNKFQPENLVVGQGYIGASSRKDATDWLKIVKTALIFLEDNSKELKEELANYNTEANDNETSDNLFNYNKKRFSPYDDEEDEENSDYDVPNQFQNFWD